MAKQGRKGFTNDKSDQPTTEEKKKGCLVLMDKLKPPGLKKLTYPEFFSEERPASAPASSPGPLHPTDTPLNESDISSTKHSAANERKHQMFLPS